MATTDSSTTTEQRIEKDLVLTAYTGPDYSPLDDSDVEAERQAIVDSFEFTEDVDPTERYEETTEVAYLEFNFDDVDEHGIERNINKTMSFNFGVDRDIVVQAIKDGELDVGDVDFLELVTESEHDEGWKQSTSDLLTDLIGQATDGLDLSEAGFTAPDYGLYDAQWSKSVDATHAHAEPGEESTFNVRVKTSSNDIEARPLLKPQADRTPESKFEDETERWSLEVQVHLEARTEAVIRYLERQLAPPLTDVLLSGTHFEETRLTSCEVVTTEEGACHDI